ncbi:thymidylate kinase [Globomyces pollinis-pini]|nr:thymidylate kinase [Globomyces pollinis-pini]
MRGALIVVEGGDRSGKTSQLELLANHIKNSKVFKFPNRQSITGSILDNYLKGQEANDEAVHLIFSANRWESKHQILDLLNSGITCLVDRYAYSGIAYSSAKGLDMEWCKNSDAGLLNPDLVLYFDISPEQAAKRGGYGEERYEVLDMQLKVREKFLQLKDDNWHVVDADRDISIIHKEVCSLVDSCISNLSETIESNLFQ